MKKEICPACRSDLTVKVANQHHCVACGLDFGHDKNPISTRALKARAEARGFLPGTVSVDPLIGS
jgi:hypothetical protein